jgi:hypothetical protein
MNRTINVIGQPVVAVATANIHAEAASRQPDRQEWLLDEALGETFPASDAISPSFIS